MKEFAEFHGEITDQAKLLKILERINMLSTRLIRERGHVDSEVLPLEDLEEMKKFIHECAVAVNDYEKKHYPKDEGKSE